MPAAAALRGKNARGTKWRPQAEAGVRPSHLSLSSLSFSFFPKKPRYEGKEKNKRAAPARVHNNYNSS
jgi:hypothetical protein